jgi:F0F1-type ATP synthase assembly protein I
MNKIVVGLVFGIILGAVDGATAWFYPETRPVITGILIGSSFKGMLVGLFSGWFARRVQSTGWGIVVGSTLGLLFAFLVAVMDASKGKSHYLEIMLPGFVVGAIIGFLTQKMGSPVVAKSGAQ